MSTMVHYSFEVPHPILEMSVVACFSQLGYRLSSQQPNRWVFTRGKRLATLWAFSVQSPYTELSVEAIGVAGRRYRVSCTHNVWTMGYIFTGAQTKTLESEARMLETELMRNTTTQLPSPCGDPGIVARFSNLDMGE